MKIESVRLVYYSPTQTSKRIVQDIAEGTQYKTVTHLDLTPPTARTMQIEEFKTELAIIAAPVYSGRLPREATHRVQRLKANKTPAVLVAVYGNRAYEDALLELKNLATGVGFISIAGAAFIGEHSYSTNEKPIALNRPDEHDQKKSHAFGKAIREKLDTITAIDQVQPLEVPGNHPYRKMGEPSNDISPITKEDVCIKCGKCAEVCPVAAITIGKTIDTNPTLCTFCTACVKNCPTNARLWTHQKIHQSTDWLYTNCKKRMEPETYL
jgi:ferredoxin